MVDLFEVGVYIHRGVYIYEYIYIHIYIYYRSIYIGVYM